MTELTNAKRGDFVVFRSENYTWQYGIVNAIALGAISVIVDVLSLDAAGTKVMVGRARIVEISDTVPQAIFIDNTGYPHDAVAYCAVLEADKARLLAGIRETSDILKHSLSISNKTNQQVADLDAALTNWLQKP